MAMREQIASLKALCVEKDGKIVRQRKHLAKLEALRKEDAAALAAERERREKAEALLGEVVESDGPLRGALLARIEAHLAPPASETHRHKFQREADMMHAPPERFAPPASEPEGEATP